MKSLLTTLALCVTLTSPILAQLNLTVNPVLNTMTLSGSATGTPNGADIVRWNIGAQTLIINSFQDIDMSAAVTQSGLFETVRSWADGGSYLAFRGSDFTSITTTGTAINYSFSSPLLETNFENNLDTTWTLSSGTGYGDLTVVAVPEPSSMALVLGLVGLFLTARRRNSKY